MSEPDKGKKIAVFVAFFFAILVWWTLFWADYECPLIKVIAYALAVYPLEILKLLLYGEDEDATDKSWFWALFVMAYIATCSIF